MKFDQKAFSVHWVIQLISARADHREVQKSGVMLHLAPAQADKIQSTVKALSLAGCDTCSSQVEEQVWLYDEDVGPSPGVLFIHSQSDGKVNFSAITPRGPLVSRSIDVSELTCAAHAKKQILVHAHDDADDFLKAVHRADLAVLLKSESVGHLDVEAQDPVECFRAHMGQGG